MSGKDDIDRGTWRYITWEIGTAELQVSVMAAESLQIMVDGLTKNSAGMRDEIRRRRDLILKTRVTGRWADDPANRFVNQHAWGLSKLTQFGVTIPGGKSKRLNTLYILAPDALARLPAALAELRRSEPYVWGPGQPFHSVTLV
jgi:hypothetical protein